MNTLITTEFMGTAVSVIDQNGKKWLTAEDVGRCLGYNEANASQGVRNLYNRHADEFTEADTCQLKLMMAGQMRELRVFSDAGCIKLGFLSNTERSKAFRTWAAKVLAREMQAAAAPSGAAMDLMAKNMAKLAEGMDALLRQNNRTDRYVALLELNQKGHVKVTDAVRLQVFELYAQKMPQASIARLLRISPSTVCQLLKGSYPMVGYEGRLPSFEEHRVALEAAIETQLAESRAVAYGSALPLPFADPAPSI